MTTLVYRQIVMTFDTFSDLMLERAGLLARVNRTASVRILTMVAQEWEEKPYEPGLRKRVKRLYKDRYGFDPLTWLIIGALVNILVRMVLEYVYDASEPEQRERANLLWKFRREMEGGGPWASGDH